MFIKNSRPWVLAPVGKNAEVVHNEAMVDPWQHVNIYDMVADHVTGTVACLGVVYTNKYKPSWKWEKSSKWGPSPI